MKKIKYIDHLEEIRKDKWWDHRTLDGDYFNWSGVLLPTQNMIGPSISIAHKLTSSILSMKKVIRGEAQANVPLSWAPRPIALICFSNGEFHCHHVLHSFR